MEEIKMKDSGIKWIGKIPEDWDIKRLKYCVRKKITDGPHETPVFVDDGIIFLSVDSIQDAKIVFENTRFISYEDAKRYDKKCKLEKNDVLIGKAASTGKIAIVDKDVYFQVWSPLAIVKTRNNILDSNFLRYYLLSPAGQENIDNFCTMNTQKNIAMEDIERLSIVIPTLQEQLKIAEFLDEKCADIDEIISKTEKQIETLEQYKKSLITETVTKGINPNVNMVFSNIKQIGNIPKHWTVKRIRYVLSENNGIKVGPFGSSLTGLVLDEGPVKIYGQWNVVDKSFNTGKNYVSLDTYSNLKKYEVKPHDILISMMGTIGGCIIVPEGIDKGIMDSHIIKIRLKKFMNPKYFYYFYDKDNSNAVFDQLEFLKTGSIMDGLNSNILKNINVCIPPLKEQDEIVNYLDKKCSDIYEILNKQKESLETLKKYKQSLIYEYVTGKKRV